MVLPPLRFTDDELRDAYPNLSITFPPLGRGSFKVAYHATDGNVARVLKIVTYFPIDDDPDEFDFGQLPSRLARELKAMSDVACPHVVTLLSDPTVRRIGDASYLTFEEPYYSGGTLEERLRGGPLPRVHVRQLAETLLAASDALWTTGQIVHRDIKPGNIAYTRSDQPILLDLGLAFFTTLSPLTDSGVASPRTDRYAAPEQFEVRRNAQIDFRTDQYLIGLTVYEAASGKHPFWDPSVSYAEYHQRMYGFRKDSLNVLDIDDDLREVLGRLLVPQVYGRYRTTSLPLRKLGVIA